MEMHERVARVFLAADMREKIKKLLALLGGRGKKAFEEDDESEAPERAPVEMLKEEWERKKKGAPKWNTAFEEKMLPHVYDHENFHKDAFFYTVFNSLKRRKGDAVAKEHIDDACSFIVANLEKYIKHVHSGVGRKGLERESDTVTIREPRMRDPNVKFLVKGHTFLGKVIKEIPGKPHEYEMEFSGGGLVPQKYTVNSTATMLDLRDGDQYKMEVVSERSTGKGERGMVLYLKVHGAEAIQDVFATLMTRQVAQVVDYAVVDFARTELPKLMGDQENVDKRTVQLKGEIEDVEGKISQGEAKGEDVGKLHDRLTKLKKQLADVDEFGFSGAGGMVDEVKQAPHFETPETRKYIEKDPHQRWFNVRPKKIKVKDDKLAPGQDLEPKRTPYTAPGTSEIAEEFSEDDYNRLKGELLHSLDAAGDLRGIPYKDLLNMMWESIESVDIKDSPKAWRVPFIKKMQEYVEKNKIPGMTTKYIYEAYDELVKAVQDKILTDDKFKRLRDNLVRQVTHTQLKTADVHMLVEAWKSPTEEALRAAYTDAALSGDAEGISKGGEFERDVVKPSVAGFKALLAKDVVKALETLKWVAKFTPPEAGRGEMPLYAPAKSGEKRQVTELRKVLERFKVEKELGEKLLGLMGQVADARMSPVMAVEQVQKMLDEGKMPAQAKTRVEDLFEDFVPETHGGIYEELVGKAIRDHKLPSEVENKLYEILDDLTRRGPIEKALEEVGKLSIPEEAKKEVSGIFERMAPKGGEFGVSDPEVRAKILKQLEEFDKLAEGLPQAAALKAVLQAIQQKQMSGVGAKHDVDQALRGVSGEKAVALKEFFDEALKPPKHNTEEGTEKKAFGRGQFQDLVQRLGHMFLTEVWQMDDMKQKRESYKGYKDAFPQDVPQNKELLMRVRQELAEFLLSDPTGLPKSEEEKRTRKRRVEIQKPEGVEKRDTEFSERLKQIQLKSKLSFGYGQ